MSMKRQMEVMTKVRQDAEDLSGFMRDLEQWHKKVRKQDDALRQSTRTKMPIRTKISKSNVRQLDVSPLQPSEGTAADHTHQKYSKWERFDPETAESESREVFNTTAAGAAPARLTPASIAYLPPEAVGSIPKPSDSTSKATIRSGASNPVLDQAEIERERGNESFRKGQFDSALRAYSRAIGMNPLDFRALSNRSMAHLKLKNTQAAEDDATAALAIDSTHVKSLYRRGVARVALGRLRDAIVDFQDALRLDPANKPAKAELNKCIEQRRTAVRRAPKQLLAGGTIALDAFTQAGTANSAKEEYDPAMSSQEVPHTSEARIAATASEPAEPQQPTERASSAVQLPGSLASEAGAISSKRRALARDTDQRPPPAVASSSRSSPPVSPHAKRALPSTATTFETLWRSIEDEARGAVGAAGDASKISGSAAAGGASDASAADSVRGQRQALLLRLGPKKFGRLYSAVAPEAGLLGAVACCAFQAVQVLLRTSGGDKAAQRMSQWLGVLASLPNRSTISMMMPTELKAAMKQGIVRARDEIVPRATTGATATKLGKACEAFIQVFSLD